MFAQRAVRNDDAVLRNGDDASSVWRLDRSGLRAVFLQAKWVRLRCGLRQFRALDGALQNADLVAQRENLQQECSELSAGLHTVRSRRSECYGVRGLLV